ncbi:MAG: YfhO family protein [Bacteroidia bacterium]|nr:YfhO family protein [Bacteroidia bacterium]
MAKATQPAQTAGLKDWQKQILTHAGIILAFLLVVILFFSPLFFEGKMVNWHDIIHFQGMAKETQDFREKTGEEALWVSTLFSGMPAYQTSTQYSGNFFSAINKILWIGLPRPANYVFLYFLGFYFLLASMGNKPWLSGIGAAAFALSSYFFIILTAGHTSKANAIAYMAPVIAGVLMAYRGKYLLGAAVTAFFLALELTVNHYQITYYLAIVIGLLGLTWLIDAIRNKEIPHFAKASGALLIAALLAIGPNAGRLLTTAEYASETMRGKAVLKSEGEQAKPGLAKEYAFNWSYGVGESFTLLIPNFYGGASGTKINDPKLEQQFQTRDLRLPTYWGDQPSTSGPVYVGAIICFLFVLGLIIVPGKIKWWLMASTILFLMLSWGRFFAGFNYFIFDFFPGYNKFRAVSMCLVIVEFTMPFLAILGLAKLMEIKDEGKPVNELNKALYIAVGITGGLALLFAVLGSQIMSFERPVDQERYSQILEILRDVRKSMLVSDAFRAFAFILASGALIWLYLRNTVSKTALLAGLAALVLLDLGPVAYRYLNEDNYITKRKYESNFAAQPADNFILQDKDPNFRVFNYSSPDGPFNDAKTSYFHKSVGGYHAAKLRRYQDMIDIHISREMQEMYNILQARPNDSALRVGLASLEIFNMLNTRYFIFDPQKQPLLNPAAMGNAWFVKEVQFVNTPDEEIAALTNFNPRTTAFVDQVMEGGKFKQQLEGFQPTGDNTGRITLTDFKPNHLSYQSSSPVEAVGIFSEVYYNDGKGWKAYIDGQAVPHFRANYILRGLRIPAGEHTIEFKFEPQSFTTGNTISLITSILLLLAFAGILFMEYRPKPRQ